MDRETKIDVGLFLVGVMIVLAILAAGCVYAPKATRVENRTILFSSRLVVADGTNTVQQTIDGGAQGTATVPLTGK